MNTLFIAVFDNLPSAVMPDLVETITIDDRTDMEDVEAYMQFAHAGYAYTELRFGEVIAVTGQDVVLSEPEFESYVDEV